MEIKTRLTLKHSDGRYLSWNPDRYPLTPRIADARRFYSTEEIASFLELSTYRPDAVGLSVDDFEICEIEIEYREAKPDEREHASVREGAQCPERSA